LVVPTNLMRLTAEGLASAQGRAVGEAVSNMARWVTGARNFASNLYNIQQVATKLGSDSGSVTDAFDKARKSVEDFARATETAQPKKRRSRSMRRGAPALKPISTSTTCCALLELGIALKPRGLQTPSS
jgi:hypothetical protein